MKTLSNNDVTRIQNLVHDLAQHNFYDAINCDVNSQADKWIVHYREYLRAMGYHIFYGATRIVVMLDDFDWVLKFNFHYSDSAQDYNELEEVHYKAAIKAGLAEHFAAMYYVGIIENLMVYAQEKVRMDEDCVSSSFFQYTLDNYYCENDGRDEDERNEDAWDDAMYLDNEDRIYAMIDSVSIADELIKFVFDNNINDLHSANWGYRGTEPVIVDYAGY